MITVTDTFHSERLYDMEAETVKKYGAKKTAYFDIETTGFSSKSEQIYLIGAAYQNDDKTFTVIQWFDDTTKDEAKMLLMFREFLKDFDVLINFNGNTFDIPFVLNRALKYGIHFNFDRLIIIDIYKDIRKYKHFFKTPDLKQKSVESFLGILREDEYNGGQLIEIYKEFVGIKNNDELKSGLRSLLLLHNHDDIIGLVNICDIFSYIEIFNGKFTAKKAALDKNNLIISCLLEFKLKSPVFDMYDYTGYGTNGNKFKKTKETIGNTIHDNSQLSSDSITGYDTRHMIRYEAHDNSLKLLIPVIEDELKYYYENYKDYYYLPDEDTAIHKSVAQFVDKNHRKKATRENCYIKKRGNFAPQPNDIFKPAFKVNHNDKYMYFEVDGEFTDRLNTECCEDKNTDMASNSLHLYVKELLSGMYF